VTSNGLTKFITDLGGKHLRFKRGYKNVIGKGIELNKQGVDCHLMMETSGHGAVKDNWFLDDGAFLAVQVRCGIAPARAPARCSGARVPRKMFITLLIR